MPSVIITSSSVEAWPPPPLLDNAVSGEGKSMG